MFLQNAVADALNNTEWAFPLAECFHIGGFAVGVGTIALVDFRMLNLGLRRETTAQMVRYTEPWTLIALVFVLFSGAALFISQTFVYIPTRYFMRRWSSWWWPSSSISRSTARWRRRPLLSRVKQAGGDRLAAAVGWNRVRRDLHRFCIRRH